MIIASKASAFSGSDTVRLGAKISSKQQSPPGWDFRLLSRIPGVVVRKFNHFIWRNVTVSVARKTGRLRIDRMTILFPKYLTSVVPLSQEVEPWLAFARRCVNAYGFE